MKKILGFMQLLWILIYIACTGQQQSDNLQLNILYIRINIIFQCIFFNKGIVKSELSSPRNGKKDKMDKDRNKFCHEKKRKYRPEHDRKSMTSPNFLCLTIYEAIAIYNSLSLDRFVILYKTEIDDVVIDTNVSRFHFLYKIVDIHRYHILPY